MIIYVQICLMVSCDKCHDDTRECYYIPVENKDDYDRLYEDFLKTVKEEGWVCHDGKCLCPSCRKELSE